MNDKPLPTNKNRVADMLGIPTTEDLDVNTDPKTRLVAEALKEGNLEKAQEVYKHPFNELATDYQVMTVVSRTGDPLMGHIYDDISGIIGTVAASEKEIHSVVMTLVHCGALRMKEDTYDHDWAYKATKYGKECYASCFKEGSVDA